MHFLHLMHVYCVFLSVRRIAALLLLLLDPDWNLDQEHLPGCWQARFGTDCQSRSCLQTDCQTLTRQCCCSSPGWEGAHLLKVRVLAAGTWVWACPRLFPVCHTLSPHLLCLLSSLSYSKETSSLENSLHHLPNLLSLPKIPQGSLSWEYICHLDW